MLIVNLSTLEADTIVRFNINYLIIPKNGVDEGQKSEYDNPQI